MQRIDRSKITEEQIISPITPAYDDVAQFREWQRRNRINNPVIDSDKSQADHIRIQARILQEHRFKLRDQK